MNVPRVFAKDEVEKSKKFNCAIHLKYVRTDKRGYVLGDMNHYHKDLVMEGYEVAESAGFVTIAFGEYIQVGKEMSTSLGLGPDTENDRDAKGLGELFELPGKQSKYGY